MEDKTGGPAFPTDCISNNDQLEKIRPGMSLRDYFAAEAMHGIITGVRMNDIALQASGGRSHGIASTWVAEQAYWMADAMIEARKK